MEYLKDLKKFLPSGSFLIMLLCFLLPFMVVKCKDNSMITVSWINFLWIWEEKNHFDKNIWWEKNSEISTEKKFYFSIILLFLIVILGFWFSSKNLFDEKKGKNVDFSKFDKIYFSSNIIIIFLLTIFIFDIKMNLLKENSKDEISKEMQKMIKVETWNGIIFIFLIAILNILYFWNELKYFEKVKEKINKKREEKVKENKNEENSEIKIEKK